MDTFSKLLSKLIKSIPLQKPQLDHDDALVRSLAKRQSTVALNNKYFYLLGDMSIGTPAQNFRVLFDTGSPTVWVRADDSFLQASYNASASSSLQHTGVTNGSIAYLDGSYAQGYYAKESVSVGTVKFQNFTVMLANNIYSSHPGMSDGVFGLSFHPVQNGEGSIIRSLLKNKTSESQVMSYYVDLSDSAGGLTFGGIDIARYSGPLSWLSVTPAQVDSKQEYDHWALMLNNLTVNGDQTIDAPTRLMMDTGTSCAAFSPAVAKRLNLLLGLEEISIDVPFITYGKQCDDGNIEKFSDMILHFSGHNITIPSRTYMYLETHHGRLYCVSGLFGIPQMSDDLIILGNLILRQFYTVFDYGSFKIGISNANRHEYVEPNIVIADSRNSPIGISELSDIGGIGASGTATYSIKILNVILLASAIVAFFIFLIMRHVRKRRDRKNSEFQSTTNPQVSHQYISPS